MTDAQASDSALYNDRDYEALDDAGDHFSRHMEALTAEGLDSKADIAAELGHRDMEITRLQRERDDLSARSKLIEETLYELSRSVLSINRGNRHMVEIDGDDEPGFIQRKEWVDWVAEEAEKAQLLVKGSVDGTLEAIRARAITEAAEYAIINTANLSKAQADALGLVSNYASYLWRNAEKAGYVHE